MITWIAIGMIAVAGIYLGGSHLTARLKKAIQLHNGPVDNGTVLEAPKMSRLQAIQQIETLRDYYTANDQPESLRAVNAAAVAMFEDQKRAEANQ